MENPYSENARDMANMPVTEQVDEYGMLLTIAKALETAWNSGYRAGRQAHEIAMAEQSIEYEDEEFATAENHRFFDGEVDG